MNKNQISKVAMADEAMQALQFLHPEHIEGRDAPGKEFNRLRATMSLEQIHGHLAGELGACDAMMPSAKPVPTVIDGCPNS